jgi:hypothetical protein
LRESRMAPVSRPKSSAEMMSNVSRLMSGSTVTLVWPHHFSSRCCLTLASIPPTYYLSMAGLRNSISAPRMRL